MATSKTATNPMIGQVVKAFSDYVTSTHNTYRDALTEYVDYQVKCCAALDDVRKAIEAGGGKAFADQSAEAINTYVRKMASDAGLTWTMTDQQITTVLAFGTLHTAGKLAAYTEYALDNDKVPAIAGYKTWLGEVKRGDRADDGKVTDLGTRRDKVRTTNTKLLAVTKSGASFNYLKDIADQDWTEQYRTLRQRQIDLEVDLAAVIKAAGKTKAAAKSISDIERDLADKRRKAAGVKPLPKS